jgi:hypothetical protein
MYLKAVEWLEDAGKDALAGDIFRYGGCGRCRAVVQAGHHGPSRLAKQPDVLMLDAGSWVGSRRC